MRALHQMRGAIRRIRPAVAVAVLSSVALSTLLGVADRSTPPIVISGSEFSPLASVEGIAVFAMHAGSTWIPLIVAGVVFGELVAEDLEIGLTRSHSTLMGARPAIGAAAVLAIAATILSTTLSAIGLKVGLGSEAIQLPPERSIDLRRITSLRSISELAIAQLFWAALLTTVAGATRSKAGTLVIAWALAIIGIALSTLDSADSWLPTIWLGSAAAGPIDSPAAALSIWPTGEKLPLAHLACLTGLLAIAGWLQVSRRKSIKLTYGP